MASDCAAAPLEASHFFLAGILITSLKDSQKISFWEILTLGAVRSQQANKKTRNRAYELLVEIGRACGDEEQGGRREYLQQFFNMVLKSAVKFLVFLSL